MRRELQAQLVAVVRALAVGDLKAVERVPLGRLLLFLLVVAVVLWLFRSEWVWW